MILCCVCVRVGNMLFSVETQTTDERTQQYQSEIEALYKDLTAKGKTLMLSTELGVRTSVCVSVSLCSSLYSTEHQFHQLLYLLLNLSCDCGV